MADSRSTGRASLSCANLSAATASLRPVVAEIREFVGEVDAESELGKWVTWASEDSDRLRYLRRQNGRTLTLYYHSYDKDSVAERGFEERTPLAWQKKKEPSGIELTARAPRLTSWERAMKLELPEDLLLPYE